MEDTGRQMVDEVLSGGKRSRALARHTSSIHKEHQSPRSLPRHSSIQELKQVSVDNLRARKPGIIPQMWSNEEDDLLRKHIKIHGEKNWREVANHIPGRTYVQCLQRWKKALRPGLVKGHWTKEEDSYLLKLVEFYAPNWDWNFISKKIEGRNAKQCRERWFLNLDPSINRGPWSEKEDAELLKFVSQWGSRWALIAKQLPGRTENSVKTRFHSLKRREARNRPWTKEEDDSIIAGVMKFGREFDVIQQSMKQGRTKGQVKKRFTILQQQRPDLMRKVYAVEDAIRQEKQKKQEQENTQSAHSRLVRRRSSAPLDQIQNTLPKTDSHHLLSSLLEETDKMDISGGKGLRGRFESTNSLSIPDPMSGAKLANAQDRPKSFRRYNTSVEMLSSILNEPLNTGANDYLKTEFDGSNFQAQNDALMKRADSLFDEAFGKAQEDVGLKKVDSFLQALEMDVSKPSDMNVKMEPSSYANTQNSSRLLKRASSSIGNLLRLESTDMKSLLNLL